MCKNLIMTAAAVCCVVLAGCYQVGGNEHVFDRFDKTVLRLSNSSDVLGMINQGRYEILSQSQSVVAVCGGDENGFNPWFYVVAFDENKLTAKRKYCLSVGEKGKEFYILPSQKLRFDAEMVMDGKVLGEPYTNEDTKRIAVLRQVLADFSGDIEQLTSDSQALDSQAMLTVQTLNGILQQLDQSPALAAGLSYPGGMGFYHTGLGKGAVRMVIDGQIVKVKIKIGKIAETLETQQDVIDM